MIGGKYSNSLSKIKKLQDSLEQAEVIVSTTMSIDSAP
jgi:hypothetical protein